MRDLLFEVSNACTKVNVPSVVRTIDVFTDGDGYELRIVIVSELARGAISEVMNDDANSHPSKHHLTLDNISTLLRRVEEAAGSAAFDGTDPWKNGTGKAYRHVMGILPPHGIFYNCATRRPLRWTPKIGHGAKDDSARQK